MPLEGVKRLLKPPMNMDGERIFRELTQFCEDQFLRSKYSFVQQLNNGRTDTLKDNIDYLTCDFPRIYLEHLPILVYPNWYTACFSKNCSNSAAWANYGDNHKGVCLIFRENHDSKEAGLTLITRTRNVPNSTQRSTGTHYKFYDVNYGLNVSKVDFFRSLRLGQVLEEILTKTWYVDGRGNPSECAAPIQGDVDLWYKKRWYPFFSAIV